jgi:spore coat protein CotH
MLSMSVYRRLGQVAPREAFARLYINNEYQGLYAVVEEIDTAFVQRSLNENSGYLFEYNYVKPFFTEDLGDDFAPYKAMFQPKNHELESDTQIYGPIRELFREINGPDDAVWRERVQERIDIAQFMTHAAIQGFLAENDGLLGYAGLNNFYMYRLANTNRHRLLPWDEDFSFTFIDSSLLRHADQPVVLFERAFAQPDFRQVFLDIAETCAHDVTENGWLSSELERYVALITAAVLEDTRKQFSNDAYAADIEFIRQFAATRTQYVLAEVAHLRLP